MPGLSLIGRASLTRLIFAQASNYRDRVKVKVKVKVRSRPLNLRACFFNLEASADLYTRAYFYLLIIETHAYIPTFSLYNMCILLPPHHGVLPPHHCPNQPTASKAWPLLEGGPHGKGEEAYFYNLFSKN